MVSRLSTKRSGTKLQRPLRAPKIWRALKELSTWHWRDAGAFYDRNKSRLVRDSRYRNRFVAIRYGRVVDVDDDKFVLADRLMKRFPDHIFFVKQVLRHEPVVHIGTMVVV